MVLYVRLSNKHIVKIILNNCDIVQIGILSENLPYVLSEVDYIIESML